MDNLEHWNRLAHLMDIADVDLNAVTAFVAVVEHRSFRAAARALGVPKSTLSRRVALLEEQLGAQLLVRTTRVLSLTDAGEAFHQRSSRALVAIADAAKELRQSETALRGVVRVTAPGTFAEHFLGDIVTEFLDANPEVRVVLDLTDRFVDLVAEGYDLALRAGTLSDSTLRAKLIATSPIVTVASPAYLKRYGAPTTPTDLSAHECIVYGNTERAAKWVFHVKRKVVAVNVRARAAVNSFLLAREFASAGLGIARMPWSFSADLESDGVLVRVLEAFAPPPSPIHVVFPAGPHLAPRVRAFLNLLSARLDPKRPVIIPKRAPTR